MPYSEFTFQKIETELRLAIDERDLCSMIEPIAISDAFAEILKENVPLALAINTEKARSELIIAPVLVELRKTLGHRVSLFSGVEFNVDPRKGLNGICDFIVSASARQMLLTAPIIQIVEAKNEDIKSGIPQCAAEMYAAQLFNRTRGLPRPYIHGVVTTGSSWRFMQLEQDRLIVDIMEYFIDNIGKILGILIDMVNRDLV